MFLYTFLILVLMVTVGIKSKTFCILTMLVCIGLVVFFTCLCYTHAVIEEVAHVQAVFSDWLCFSDGY